MFKNKNKKQGHAAKSIFERLSAKQLSLHGKNQPILFRHLPSPNLSRFCTSGSFFNAATHILNHGKSDFRHYLKPYLLQHALDPIYINDFNLDIQGAGHDHHSI
ncbi:hypothetical protein [Acinetobacter sp. LoGeW2-3]|uniref:hypothetical protein n=1 Tax=Acinetobacter sp. LoGeW2-3 TaxID=1808001 RepID=UPI0012376FB1|nr:hypothetical protein [Acinetobacter sp. LoGeW2-3]